MEEGGGLQLVRGLKSENKMNEERISNVLQDSSLRRSVSQLISFNQRCLSQSLQSI